MTVETRDWKGEIRKDVFKTDNFLHSTEQFLKQKTDSGWLVWYDARCYDENKRLSFDGYTFYGEIFVTKQDAEGKYTTW